MRILLADSSRHSLPRMAALLRSRGHDVVSYSDGKAALTGLETDETIDLVIASLELRGLAGTDLCWTARAMASPWRPIQVMALTKHLDEAKLEEALDCGADEVLRRPVRPVELFARLRAMERLRQMAQELIRRATEDPLTGLNNRRSFFERATPLCEQPGALMMLDIDHFKSVNDRFGHQAGDAVLRAVGQVLLRAPGICGRLGGEEFALLLPNLRPAQALREAETLRASIAALHIPSDGKMLRVTASFGVAPLEAGPGIDRLLQRADHALYHAKQTGRNRVANAPALDLPNEAPRVTRQASRASVPSL